MHWSLRTSASLPAASSVAHAARSTLSVSENPCSAAGASIPPYRSEKYASPTAAFTSSNAGTLTETFISVRSSGLIVTWYSTWSKSAARTSTACRGWRVRRKWANGRLIVEL